MHQQARLSFKECLVHVDLVLDCYCYPRKINHLSLPASITHINELDYENLVLNELDYDNLVFNELYYENLVFILLRLRHGLYLLCALVE